MGWGSSEKVKHTNIESTKVRNDLKVLGSTGMESSLCWFACLVCRVSGIQGLKEDITKCITSCHRTGGPAPIFLVACLCTLMPRLEVWLFVEADLGRLPWRLRFEFMVDRACHTWSIWFPIPLFAIALFWSSVVMCRGGCDVGCGWRLSK